MVCVHHICHFNQKNEVYSAENVDEIINVQRKITVLDSIEWAYQKFFIQNGDKLFNYATKKKKN